MIIQTPELIRYKQEEAESRIDKYLMILVTFEKGLVFGVKFNERQNKPAQWLMEINSTSMIGGIGDLRDFKFATRALCNFCQDIANLVGKHYLTGDGVVNFLVGLLQKEFEEKSSPLAVNFIVADWHDEGKPDLWFVDYDGNTKQLKDFVVGGGSEYAEVLTEAETKKLSQEEKDFLELQKLGIKEKVPQSSAVFLSHIYYPRKKAIAYLEEHWKPEMNAREAVVLVKKCLFKCDPESKNKIIEVSVIEAGKEVKIHYFKKSKKQK